MAILTWKQAVSDYEKKSAGSNDASTTAPFSGMLSWKQAADEFDRYDEDGYKALGKKRITQRQQIVSQREERASVSDWANRYNRIMKGVADYDKQRNGGYTRDASGGYGSEIDALIRDFGSIQDIAGRYGVAGAKRYLDNLRDIQKYISDTNGFMSQFQDEDAYNRYMDYWKDQEEKKNLDLDAYSQEIAALEQKIDEYDYDWTDANARQQASSEIEKMMEDVRRKKQF